MKIGAKSIVLVTGICAIIGLIGMVLGGQLSDVPTGSRSAGTILNKPAWDVGDWWTVEESYLVIQAAVADPPWVGPLVKRMEVTGIEQVNGEECYVVVITDDSPKVEGEGVRDTIYYRTSDLSLVKVDHLIHSTRVNDVHLVYEGENVGDGMSPKLYMVPSFPASTTVVSAGAVSFDLPGVANASKVDYSNVTDSGADAKYNAVDNPGGYPSRQIWHPNAPWWLYHDEPYMKARLVDCSRWHK